MSEKPKTWRAVELRIEYLRGWRAGRKDYVLPISPLQCGPREQELAELEVLKPCRKCLGGKTIYQGGCSCCDDTGISPEMECKMPNETSDKGKRVAGAKLTMTTKTLKLYFWEDTLNVVGGKWGTLGYMLALAYSLREARALLKKALKAKGQWSKVAEKDLATAPEVIVSPCACFKLGEDGG